MSTADDALPADPSHLGHHNDAPAAQLAYTGAGAGGPASKRIVVGYGFWIFILSDVILFATLFATYAVLAGNRAGGPGPHALFDLRNTAEETLLLLFSSFACGMASLAVARRNLLWTQLTLLITGLLGAGFLALEAREFADLVARGAGPTHSAFLSAFFTLVGCHGLHVTAGLLWLGTMMAQFWAKGFRQNIRHRFLCFTLFWHALDIIWVGIFSLVYLIGEILP
ncbi:MAG TPA: cytochrome (ubi)quinol oxidase subunit III [Steroidobacteraceae bacterium]|jgi:cytochrome o ubiquinol oxidase subunit 3|nr:cytochrome (ubi)quinol oxidase subunit III [Steroidobacteraceae bacterium]